MKRIKDPGFGYSSSKNSQSMINEKGHSNVIHKNKSLSINDTYAYLIDISWFKFFIFVFISYIIVNTIFATIYLLVGIEQITNSTGSKIDDFFNAFFFSAQTITTVGYGGLSPQGFIGNVISTFQALTGLLSFSFITGLLYGRFSKPKAAVKFSNNVVLRDYEGGMAVMFKLMNYRPSIMIDPEVTVIYSNTIKAEDGNFKKDYFRLKLQMDKLKYLTTTWTIVHEIDNDSPFAGMTKAEIKMLDAELYVLIQYHDETFSQQVNQMHSYKADRLLVDVKFKKSFSFDEEGYTVLDHSILSDVEKMN
ncbi:inward rectifier potassium channel [Lutibacter oricola]|uniref:Inward rectifier potassium channel n=1 Tax=Lutibacter oricola TaxID=762486 RepID=A0A1H2U0N7_9FLAO|nr:ion channel [Lutibacter oricola]SDW49782.1 inward rectifier potassium channel [Lutibacter oricola]